MSLFRQVRVRVSVRQGVGVQAFTPSRGRWIAVSWRPAWSRDRYCLKQQQNKSKIGDGSSHEAALNVHREKATVAASLL